MKTNKTKFFAMALVISIFLASIVFAEPKSLLYNKLYPSASSSLSGYATAIPPNPNIGGNAIEVQPDPSKSPTFVVKENGWVGIGTQSPNSSLHVKTSAGQLKVSESGANSVNLTVKDNAGTGYGSLIQDAANYWWSNSGNIRMVLDDSGKLGVGTVSPSAKLEVNGSGGSNVDLVVNGRIQSGGTTYGGLWVDSDKTIFVGNDNKDNIGFYGSGAGWGLLMNKTSGRVGVGISTPQTKLHVVGTDSSGYIVNDMYGGNAAVSLRRANGAVSNPLPIKKDERFAFFGGSGYAATGWPTGANDAAIDMYASEDHTDTAQGSYMTFGTKNTGTVSRTEKMRITDDGKVGIGTNDPQVKFHVRETKDSTYPVLGAFDFAGTSGIPHLQINNKVGPRSILQFNAQDSADTVTPNKYFNLDFDASGKTFSLGGSGVDKVSISGKLEVSDKLKSVSGLVVGTNSANAKNGITLYDKVTGAPNCITIESGSLAVEPGVACA